MYLDFPSEKVIEDYIVDQMEGIEWNPILASNFDGEVVRQYTIPGYGTTDILTIELDGDESLVVTIYELKNETLKESHISQLCRYLAGAKRLLRRYPESVQDRVHIRGCLAGPFDAQRGDFVYLVDHLDIDVFSLSLCMDRGFVCDPVPTGWRSGQEVDRIPRDILGLAKGLMSHGQLQRRKLEVVGGTS